MATWVPITITAAMGRKKKLGRARNGIKQLGGREASGSIELLLPVNGVGRLFWGTLTQGLSFLYPVFLGWRRMESAIDHIAWRVVCILLTRISIFSFFKVVVFSQVRRIPIERASCHSRRLICFLLAMSGALRH